MALKPAIWYPIAVALSIVNVVAAGFAWQPGAPLHAAGHLVLALGFGFWAARLKQGLGTRELQDQIEILQIEVSEIRKELSEAQERIDFAERLLAQEPLPRQVKPED